MEDELAVLNERWAFVGCLLIMTSSINNICHDIGGLVQRNVRVSTRTQMISRTQASLASEVEEGCKFRELVLAAVPSSRFRSIKA